MWFSVIVPVYNVAPYLRQCLDSLVNQTCTDREILVVDDGSTDGSGNICDEYAFDYPFVKVIHQENQGLSSARNTGLSVAQGEWISFVDSDDWVEPDMLEVLQGHILASQADIYRLSTREVLINGEKIDEPVSGEDDFVFSFPDEKSRFRFYDRTFMSTVRVWGGAYRRSIIEDHQLRFTDTKKIYSEDLLFNFQYMLYARKVAYLHNLSYYYRKREGSLMDVTGFVQKLTRVGTLCELAYQSIEKAKMLYFQQHFYQLYFRILNRFIQRDGESYTDRQIRQILDHLAKRPFHRKYLKQIQKHSYQFRRYTNGRVWYSKSFGKRSVWDLADRFPLIWRVWFCCRNFRYILSGTTAFEPMFQKDTEYKVAYLSMPKAACSSIGVSMLRREDVPDDYTVFLLRRGMRTEKQLKREGWFVFTFVRNPFARLVSCYESKFHTDRTKNRQALDRGYFDFDRYLHGYLKADRGFACFVDQICKIPWRLDNPHFCSQYYRIVGEDGKPLADYIGRVEHLEADYEPIRKKYNFAPLKVYNKSEHGDWQDYYTTELVKKVYRKYKKDVQYFGYQKDYQDLLAYCAKKEANV